MVWKECMHGWDGLKLKVSIRRTQHMPQSLFPGSPLRWSTGGGDYCSSSRGTALQRKTAIYSREVIVGTWLMSSVSMSNLQRSVWPQSHAKGAEPGSAQPVSRLCRCSMDVAMQIRRGSSSKEGAGQRGRKRKTGRAAMLCRDKVTPLQDRSVHG